jgi:hypothetical protein
VQIDGEEYGEALALAQAYGLDCDLVYQRQWRKSPVSLASISDYLVGSLALHYSLVNQGVDNHLPTRQMRVKFKLGE